MAAISNTKKAEIQELIIKGKSLEEIAQITKVSLSSVENYIEKLTDSLIKINQNKVEEVAPTPAPATPKVVRGPKAIDMIQKRTEVKENKGVAIMTPGASQRLDEARKKMSKNTAFDDCIFKPLDNPATEE